MADSSSLESDILFGRLVVEQGLATAAQVEECLSALKKLAAGGAAPLPRLADLLTRKGYLSTSQVEATLHASRQTPSSRVSTSSRQAPLPPEVEEAAKEVANTAGKYVRVKRLGTGGMGEVWRAWDRELRRWVALKFLRGEDPGEVARFEREAQTAAKLSHPNIAAVYEVGHGERPYIAMQLVEGQTLVTFPRDDRKVLVDLLRDAALAVQYAHERGIVHRDLKPANLMVEGSRVTVLDFGLAKQSSVDSSLSIAGSVMGTPAYMPPEQARGELSKVDARSDVYSLGATLYELLADRPPFADREVYAILRRVVEEDPLPLRKANPRIDPELETIVMKCLEKDPVQRYATAREFADDLDRWRSGEPIQAHPPSTAYRLRKYVAKRRGVLLPTAAAILLGAAFGAWAIAGAAGKSRKIRDGLASGAREEKAMDLSRARDAYKSVLDLEEHAEARAGFERADSALKGIAARKERDRIATDEAIKLIEQGRPALDQAARYLYNRDAVYEELVRRVEQGQGLIEKAIQKAPGLPSAQYLLGRAWELRGWDDQAEACLRKAIALDPAFGPAHHQLGRLLLARSLGLRYAPVQHAFDVRRATAERVAAEAVKEFEASKGRSVFDDALQAEIAETMLAYGRRDYDAVRRLAREGIRKHGTTEGAEEFHLLLGLTLPDAEQVKECDEALAIRPKHAMALFCLGSARGNDPAAPAIADYTEALKINPRLVAAWVNRGILRHDEGDPAGAVSDLTEALKVDPLEASALSCRASARLDLDDIAGAIADCDEALRIDPKFVPAFVTRGSARHEKKDGKGAMADFEAALSIEPDNAEALNNRALARQAQGNADGAFADVEAALKVDPRSVEAWTNRGFLKQSRGDLDGALADHEEAIRLNPRNSHAYVNRGAAWVEKGEFQKGIADYDRALKLNSRDTEAWHNRGLAKQLTGDADGAIADSSEAIRRKPDHAEAFFNRGNAYESKQQAAKALADYDESIRLNPKYPEVYVNRASIKAQRLDLDGAIADVTKALEVAPVDWGSRKDVEALLAQLKKVKGR